MILQLKDPNLLKQHCYLNGKWREATSGLTLPVTNPATGETIACVPDMGSSETEDTIVAAEQAFSLWKKTTVKARALLLRNWFNLILAHRTDLALLLTAEQGKPLAEAEAEIIYGASYIEWYAEEAKRIYGDTIPPNNSDTRLFVLKEPIGVTAAITPWNFPNAMITRKVAPALAAGCTIIVRPASQTPLSALALAELADRAGFPPGVFSVITGNAHQIADVFCRAPQVRKLSFTGSTAVGRQLIAQCAPTVKKLSMELGGNAPFIVFEDADIDAALQGVLTSKFRNSGQTCICANRIYVQASVHDRFVNQLAQAMGKLKVGNGLTSGIQQGPLIDEQAVHKVESHIADALANGATLVMGGKRHPLGQNFFEPTLLTGAKQGMRVAREETFGPLAAVFRFDTEEEVIHYANDTEFGLASYFYTRDVGRVFRVAEQLQYGMVAVNSGVLSNEAAPFGGVKQSGLGREGSRYGLDDYLEIKYLNVAGLGQ